MAGQRTQRHFRQGHRMGAGDSCAASSYARFLMDEDDTISPLVILTKFEPGEVVDPHTHGTNYFEYVVEGEQTVGKTRFGPGDVRFAKAGTGYGPIVVGPEGCTVVIVFQEATGANTIPLGKAQGAARKCGRVNRLRYLAGDPPPSSVLARSGKVCLHGLRLECMRIREIGSHGRTAGQDRSHHRRRARLRQGFRRGAGGGGRACRAGRYRRRGGGSGRGGDSRATAARRPGLRGDVTDEARMGEVMAQAAAIQGGIDILINNAGLHSDEYGQPITKMGLAKTRRLFEVNVIGDDHAARWPRCRT